MSRRHAIAAAALVLAAGSGCFTIRYERRAVAEPGPPREQMHHGFVAGLIEGEKVDLATICPAGVVSVTNEVAPVDALIHAAEYAIVPVLLPIQAPVWEPSTVRIVCAKDGVTLAGTQRKLRIALLRLTALGDVDAKTVALLGETLGGELRKRVGLSVMSEADISALLGMERTRAMLGCTDAGCIAEVGGALGVDRVVHGSIGRVGTSLLVNLSSLDPKRASTAASVSERLKGAADEAFLDALPRIVDQLIAEPGK